VEETHFSSTYLTDLATRVRTWEVDRRDAAPVKREQYLQQPVADLLPEDMMDQLSELMGDAGGRVTVGSELSNNLNYNKAQAFVSFSVTCNNNLGTMQQVHSLVQPIVRQLTRDDLASMAMERDSYAQGGSIPGKVSGPPVKAAQAKGPVAKPAGAPKPSFRR